MPGDFSGYGVSKVQEAQFRKNILYLDDCEGAQYWGVTGTGSDFSAVEAVATSIFGSKALKMMTRATSPAEDDVVNAMMVVTYPHFNSVYSRLRLRLPVQSIVKDFQWLWTFEDGVKEYKAGIKYDQEAKTLSYWNSAGAWAAITGYAFVQCADQSLIFQFDLDLSTHKYGSVLFMGVETSIAANLFQEVGAGTSRYGKFTLVLTALTNSQSCAHVDSIYVGELEEF